MNEEKKAECKSLALEVAEIVHVVAARLVEQVVETIHESHIAPRRKTLKALWKDAVELYHGNECRGIGRPDGECTCGLVAFLSKLEAACDEAGV